MSNLSLVKISPSLICRISTGDDEKKDTPCSNTKPKQVDKDTVTVSNTPVTVKDDDYYILLNFAKFQAHDFLESFEKFKDKPYIKDLLIEAGISNQRAFYKNFDRYKNETYISEVMIKILPKYKDSGMWEDEFLRKDQFGQYSKFESEPYAKDVVMAYAELCPRGVLEFPSGICDKPYGKDVYIKALKKSIENKPDLVFKIFGRYTNEETNKFLDEIKKENEALIEAAITKAAKEEPASFLDNFDSIKDKPYAEKLLEIAAKEAAKREDNVFFRRYDLFKDKPYAEKLIKEAANNLAQKDPTSVCSYYFNEVVKKDPQLFKDVVKKALNTGFERDSPWVIFFKIENFKDEDYAKDVLLKFAEKYPGYLLKELDDNKTREVQGRDPNINYKMLIKLPYYDEILKTAVSSAAKKDPEQLLKSKHYISGKDYEKALIKEAVANLFRVSPSGIFNFYDDVKGNTDNEKIFFEAAKQAPEAVFKNFYKFKDEKFAPELIKIAVQQDPILAVEHICFYRIFPSLKNTKDSFLRALHQAVLEDTEAVIDKFNEFSSEREAAMEVLDLIADAEPRMFYENLSKFSREDYFEEVLLKQAKKQPYYALKFYDQYKHKPYAENILKEAAKSASIGDPLALFIFKGLYKGKPWEKEINDHSGELKKCLNELFNKTNISQRKKYLDDTLMKLNENFLQGLEVFNKNSDVSLECMGIVPGQSMGSEKSFEFVLVNTFKNSSTLPVRIGVKYEELISLKTKDDVVKFLVKKIAEEKKAISDEQNLWGKNINFDFSTGNAAAFIVAIPKELTGIESDFARIAEVCNKDLGAQIYGVCVENPEEWSSIPLVKEMGNKGLMTKPEKATKQTILLRLEESLKKAIDDKKSTFFIPFLMHGSRNGEMAALGGSIRSEEFAEMLSKDHNGKPICSQINIAILGESCHSGSQIDGTIKCLENKTGKDGKPIEVKDLLIVATSSTETPSFAGTTPTNSSLLTFRCGDDRAGAFTYYFTYYFEMVEHLKSQGVKIKEPVGTFVHAVQFADRMAREDSPMFQNAGGYRYSTVKKKSEYFTRISNEKLFSLLSVA